MHIFSRPIHSLLPKPDGILFARANVERGLLMLLRPKRPVGVTATIDAAGRATVSAASGGEVTLAMSASMPGLSPVEMLDAALAGCLVISLKVAAAHAGLAARLGDVRVEVIGAKAEEGPSRIARQSCRIEIDGDLDAEEKARLIAGAHALCTVGHSLETGIEIVDV
jgi:uncharacterized OsmC-like protein